jgi:hypothetical protein
MQVLLYTVLSNGELVSPSDRKGEEFPILSMLADWLKVIVFRYLYSCLARLKGVIFQTEE